MKKYKHTELISNILIIFMLVILLTVTITSGSVNKSVDETYKPIYRGESDEKKVSLMINVYWGTEYVIEMAEIIKNYGFNTTFFLGGMWVAKNVDILKKLDEMGFELGNHGYNHKNHGSLSYEDNQKEIVVTENLIKSITGKSAHLFAPPSGDTGDNMYKFCENYGYKVILWSKDTIDWRDKDEALVYSRAVDNLESGDLILMHPTEHTLKALPKILDTIVEKGYIVTNVSDII